MRRAQSTGRVNPVNSSTSSDIGLPGSSLSQAVPSNLEFHFYTVHIRGRYILEPSTENLTLIQNDIDALIKKFTGVEGVSIHIGNIAN